jgi:hypothetical protein
MNAAVLLKFCECVCAQPVFWSAARMKGDQLGTGIVAHVSKRCLFRPEWYHLIRDLP